MSSAIYIAMLLGVTWLCIWSALPDAMRRRFWSPFDFREEEAAPATRAAPPPEGEGWRARAQRREVRGR